MKLQKYAEYLPYIIFIVALLSTIISLSLSLVFNFQPCVLCWYQRICMYPLTVISAVAIMRNRTVDLAYYILPLSIIGFIIALYHNLLIWHILPESIAPCTAGVSCVNGQPVDLFGFVTVPFGSMISFAGITLFVLLYAKFGLKKEKVKPSDSNRKNLQSSNNRKTTK
jgi:disulfide bond formation protein DsbB